MVDVLLLVIVTTCAFSDLRYHKIYNFITLPAIIIGLGLNAFSFGWAGLGRAAIGMAIGGGVFLPFFFSGGMGGGDVKLMAAIGALMGFPFVILALFYTALVGGAMALSVMIWKGTLWQSLKRIGRIIFTLFMPGLKVETPPKNETQMLPYGFAISIGTFIAWLLRGREVLSLW